MSRSCYSYFRASSRQASHASWSKTDDYSPRQRLLKVAVVGEPNSGKSTFTNQIVGNRVSAVTPVIHTTRKKTLGVYTVDNTQIVLQDTPGLIPVREGRRLKMTKEHLHSPMEALQEAELITVIHDASRKRTKYRLHEMLIEKLNVYRHLPAILVLNKADLLKDKTDLLRVSTLLVKDRVKDQWGYESMGGWSQFKKVFMVSSLTRDGLDDITEYMISMAKPGRWPYSASTKTDLSLDQRISEVIRENLLLLYQDEIPWQVKQVTVLCDTRNDGSIRIHQKLYTRKKSQRRCIMEKLPELTMRVTGDLEEVFGVPVEFSMDIDVREKHTFDLPLQNY